jgi:hypothetical protein
MSPRLRSKVDDTEVEEKRGKDVKIDNRGFNDSERE